MSLSYFILRLCGLALIPTEIEARAKVGQYSGTSLIRSSKFRAPRSTGQVL